MSTPADTIQKKTPERTAPDKKKKLGKGLGALLGEMRREEPLISAQADGTNSGEPRPSADSGLAQISVALISPLPGQPRRHFDEDALEELAASIAQRGVIQPVIVRPFGKGRYQLIAGERRWRAAQKARLHEIPALVRDLDEREVMALALIENIQREDLNPIEEATAYQRLAEQEGMTQSDIAKLVDKSRSHVANLQRLLSLPEGVTELVARGELSMGHARALIGHEDALALAQRAAADSMSVREVEALIRQGRAKPPKQSDPAGKQRRASRTARQGEGNADIIAVQSHLEDILGLQVRIRADDDPRSGRVVINYRTLDQLDLVCQRLTGGEI